MNVSRRSEWISMASCLLGLLAESVVAVSETGLGDDAQTALDNHPPRALFAQLGQRV